MVMLHKKEVTKLLKITLKAHELTAGRTVSETVLGLGQESRDIITFISRSNFKEVMLA